MARRAAVCKGAGETREGGWEVEASGSGSACCERGVTRCFPILK
jgi:hypothetical protein